MTAVQSSDDNLNIFQMINVSPEPDVETITVCSFNDMHPGQFMAVVYDKDWYIGCILERSYEHQDILVKFMNK